MERVIVPNGLGLGSMTSEAVQLTEIQGADGPVAGLAERVLAGEVVVVRGGLQAAGLLDEIVRKSLGAVRAIFGDEIARKVDAEGFEHIHSMVPIDRIPELTDAIYRSMTDSAAQDLKKILLATFKGVDGYYFEDEPNVRFHIPFDAAREHKRLFDEFAEKRGEGKLSAHGPHRDSWLDCPDNGMNIWMAIGRVRRGNGLTVYADQYRGKQKFDLHGDLADGERVTEPLTFDLEPGDFILFQTDHLHGSELNRLDETRFVISYRMTFDLPHFPRGHYHPYRSSRLADGPFRALAKAPAMMQPSYVRSLGERAWHKLFPRGEQQFTPTAPAETLTGMAVGEIRAVDATTCVARLAEDNYAAFNRRCPHKGADFANGFVADGKIVCPWHNLGFDPVTGLSSCQSLKGLALLDAHEADGQLKIAPRARKPRKSSVAAAE
jgi:nitrite reductase/ring-hydroxylating ferredoxin subunit